MARVVTLRIASIGVKFSGELSKDGQSLEGSFEQGATSFDLRLDKQPGPLVHRRPQDPEPPYPYDTKNVQFPSEAPGVTLAGTLSWPRGLGPFPAVVLVSGSGPQNRDEELLNHRPFLVLADALVRRNIAVLRYDDRGVGESTGDFAQATTADFALDARGAARYLSTQADFEIGGLGIVGHSEGGAIAPIAADVDPSVAFLVLLAGPGVDGKTTLLSQQRAIAAAGGSTEAELDEAETANRTLLACFEAENAITGGLDAFVDLVGARSPSR